MSAAIDWNWKPSAVQVKKMTPSISSGGSRRAHGRACGRGQIEGCGSGPMADAIDAARALIGEIERAVAPQTRSTGRPHDAAPASQPVAKSSTPGGLPSRKRTRTTL